MSHVDSGALHAYLDGALDEYPGSEANRIREHLDVCAECAVRLEEQRAVRAAAQGILDQAVPTVDLPSLEELRAYVKATRPAPSRLSVTIYRLGWAASVVLAVGVGWVARGGQPESTEVPLMAPVAAPSADVAEGDVVFAPTEAQREQAENEPMVGASQPSTTLAGRSIELERAEEAVALPSVPAEQEVVAAIDEVVADSDVDDMLRELDVPAAFAPSDIVASAGVGVASEEQERLADTRATGNRIEIVPAPEPAAEEARRAAPERARRESATARLDVAPSTGLRQAELQGADEFADHEIEFDAIPDVEVVSFASLESSAGHSLVQRLGNGMMIDVYHIFDPEADPDEVLPEDSGRNEVRQQRETGWIVLRSEASLVELRELLARFPAGS